MPEKKSEKQEVTKTEKAETGQHEETKVPTALIYLGPPISGVAMPGTVYQKGLPQQLQKMKEECPALGKLLVSVGFAAQVRRALQDPQSAVSFCYQRVVEYMREGAKE